MNALASGWSRSALVELQAKKKWALNGGPFGSKLVQRDYVDSGVPVIRGINLTGDAKFNDNDFVYVSERKADELRANNAQPGDVIFTQRGTLGQVGLIPKKSSFPRYVISQSQMKMTVDESQVLPEWIYYFFTAPLTVNELMNKAFSSGVPHINLGILRELQVLVPPLATQRKISAILSAYGDLIENNLRRIKILEEMAQNLYSEWFVKFRFPGHEQARFADSPLSPIPEGWEVRELSEFVDFERGVEPGSRNYSSQPAENCVPFLRVGDLGKRESDLFIEGSFAKGRILTPNDIAITMDGTVGLVGMGLKGAYSSGIRRVVRNSNCPIGDAFIFQLLKSDHVQAIIEAHAKGTTIKHASSSIGHMLFALPDKAVADVFEEHAEPLNVLTLSLKRRNDALRRTRDLLLPNLISGELDVSQLDIAVPEEVGA